MLASHIYEDNQMLQPSPVIQTKDVIYLGALQYKEGSTLAFWQKLFFRV